MAKADKEQSTNQITQLDDDDPFYLSEQAMTALAEFYREQNVLKDMGRSLEENWQLSQFWYSDETADALVAECINAVDDSASVACISCPTLIEGLLRNKGEERKNLNVKLLEYDTRFSQKYPSDFVFYDYNDPLSLPENCCNEFDLIVIDPPFLSDECFVKVAQTVRLLSRNSSTKLIICTGIAMESMVERLFNAHRCSFTPSHRRNLANEFACFANYETAFL